MDSELRTRVANSELKYMFDPDEYDSSEETDRPDNLKILYNFLSLYYPSTDIVFIPDHIFHMYLSHKDKSTCVKKISITYNTSEKNYEITRFKKNDILCANDPILINEMDDVVDFIDFYFIK